MKPAAFEYADPGTLSEVLSILKGQGDACKVLAGGQSLVPLLNMRLAMPEVLLDINRVKGLDALEVNGELAVGALVRQSQVEADGRLRSQFPLLHEAIRFVGHPQIRNRGTVLGSLAHADPAAELPVVFTALDGSFDLVSADGSRTLQAHDFFVHIMTTALQPDELLVRASLPPSVPSEGSCFLEVARRHGDFAVVSAAVSIRLEGRDIVKASIAMGGVGPTPVRASRAEDWLLGNEAGELCFREAGRIASTECTPGSDIHGSAEYRRDVAAALVSRCLLKAYARASDSGTKEATADA